MEKKVLLHTKTYKTYPCLYAFTWNPNPSKFIWDEDYPLHLFKEHQTKLKWMKDVIDFIVPEFSDTGKLHYHALLKINSDGAYWEFIDGIKRIRKTGFINVQRIKDDRGLRRWINYCGETWTRTNMKLFREMTPFQSLTYDKLIDTSKSEVEEIPTSHLGHIDLGPTNSPL